MNFFEFLSFFELFHNKMVTFFVWQTICLADKIISDDDSAAKFQLDKCRKRSVDKSTDSDM